MNNKSFFVEAVTETLRFDPPVHNTRRVLGGQNMLLVLAAANRDPAALHEPMLSFGAGHHTCVASQLAINMTAETLYYLFNKYSKIDLEERTIRYEPLVNLRLPCSIRLSLGK